MDSASVKEPMPPPESQGSEYADLIDRSTFNNPLVRTSILDNRRILPCRPHKRSERSLSDTTRERSCLAVDFGGTASPSGSRCNLRNSETTLVGIFANLYLSAICNHSSCWCRPPWFCTACSSGERQLRRILRGNRICDSSCRECGRADLLSQAPATEILSTLPTPELGSPWHRPDCREYCASKKDCIRMRSDRHADKLRQ